MYIVLVQALGQREARDLLHPETHPGRSEHEAAGNHHLLGEMPARPGQQMELRIGKVRGIRRPQNAGVQHPVHPLEAELIHHERGQRLYRERHPVPHRSVHHRQTQPRLEHGQRRDQDKVKRAVQAGELDDQTVGDRALAQRFRPMKRGAHPRQERQDGKHDGEPSGAAACQAKPARKSCITSPGVLFL